MNQGSRTPRLLAVLKGWVCAGGGWRVSWLGDVRCEKDRGLSGKNVLLLRGDISVECRPPLVCALSLLAGDLKNIKGVVQHIAEDGGVMVMPQVGAEAGGAPAGWLGCSVGACGQPMQCVTSTLAPRAPRHNSVSLQTPCHGPTCPLTPQDEALPDFKDVIRFEPRELSKFFEVG